MATMIVFPERDSSGTFGPAVRLDPTRFNPTVPIKPRSANPRHRGLHLSAAGEHNARNPRQSHQEQADRIVAQVEREIEQQAERERAALLHRTTQFRRQVEPRTQYDTPATVARRLFAALLGLARPA